MMIGFIMLAESIKISTIPLALLSVSEVDGPVFTIAIVDQLGKDDNYRRSINIACSSGCKHTSELMENFEDDPLGIFRASDQNNIVYVSSSGGSSYKISAYFMGDGLVKRVLYYASLTPPMVFFENGKEHVIVRARPSQKSKKSMMVEFEWDGKKFIETGFNRNFHIK